VRFQELAASLGASLFGADGRMEGVGIMCFATVNCNIRAASPVAQSKGRLYVFIAGSDFDEIDALDLKTRKCLEVCGAAVSAR
jgi:hypothetical protein